MIPSVSLGQNAAMSAVSQTTKVLKPVQEKMGITLERILADNMPDFKKYLRLNDEQAALKQVELGIAQKPDIVEYFEKFRKSYQSESNRVKDALALKKSTKTPQNFNYLA